MASVELRAFAAARAALGWSRRSEAVAEGTTVADLLSRLRTETPSAGPVLERCAVLLDGRRVDAPQDAVVRDASRMDLLPPFAGG